MKGFSFVLAVIISVCLILLLVVVGVVVVAVRTIATARAATRVTTRMELWATPTKTASFGHLGQAFDFHCQSENHHVGHGAGDT